MLSYRVVLCSLFALLAFATAQGRATPVHAVTCTNSYLSGSAAPVGYGVSWNTLTAARELLVQGTDCTTTSSKVKVGAGNAAQYVYNKGYYWDGTQRKQYNLTGTSALQGDASYWQLQGVMGAPAGGGGGGGTGGTGRCIAPPTLNNPIIYKDKCPEDAGGPKNVNNAGRDVLIELPRDRVCTSGLSVTGSYPTQNGGNVIIRGGAIKPPSGDKLRLITIRALAPGKTAHIEGVYLDSNGLVADNIREYGNDGVKFVVQNSYIGYQTSSPNFHGDCIQFQGAGHPESITIQNVTCVPGGNGLQIPHSTLSLDGGNIGAKYYRLDRVNVRRYKSQGNNINICDVPGSKAWNAGYQEDCPKPPGEADFKDVWVNITNTVSIFNDAFAPTPKRIGSTNCGDWPHISNVNGKVCEGDPQGGDFAPVSKVGLNYDRVNFCQ